MKKKICVVTGSRAEYGLFYPLLGKIRSSGAFRLQVIATGMHLSPKFGLTFREIEKDGFKIDEKVKMLLPGDTPADISRSVGLGCSGFAGAFARLEPDLVVVLGDRFEIFSAAIAAFIAKIPVAHIHGGELTEGAMDDAFRHSITKMSALHFTSTGEYRRRVIQLGEPPERVFNVGALGIDNIRLTKLLSKKESERALGLKFGGKAALVTFHPATLETGDTGKQFRELLKALDAFKELKLVFTMPNTDPGGAAIAKLIDLYVKDNPERACSFASLGRVKYLSCLKHIDVVIGNSSSGIIEAPSFGKPTVNIGSRQQGRIRADSVIDCDPVSAGITRAIRKALSVPFAEFCRSVKNPYGDGKTTGRIVNALIRNAGRFRSLKKRFYDIKHV
jgi:GDP/UDP-N,N'-diacetylbacillosamine 2-epimerase (hydrolysing)